HQFAQDGEESGMPADFHVHSSYSFDSDSPLSAYLDRENHLLLTTDHLELANSVDDGRDDVPDFAEIARQMEFIRQESGDAGLETVVGAEVGYCREHLGRLEELVATDGIALRLLSFHAYQGH
ncbi:hypothetical protein CRD60_08360, partial [Bifidobacterium aemilianum]